MSCSLKFTPQSLLLAPMAGVNDPVFRALCRRMGAQFTYTEMISSKGLAYKNERTQAMLSALPQDKPFAVQLFGTEPEVMARQASALIEQHGRDITLIDLNMGCPARKVASKGGGAALMAQPELAERIIEAVVQAVCPVPVTVKLRKGYYAGEDIAVSFALRAEAAGAQAVAVHGRTAAELYTGRADRELVSRVAAAVAIPVIASGDVFSKEDIAEYRARGAQAVMVARGARGNPWIFCAQDEPALDATAADTPDVRAPAAGMSANGTPAAAPRRAAPSEVSLAERVALVREHTQGLAALEPYMLVRMRKHFAWYFKSVPGAAAIRRAVQQAVTLNDYLSILDAL